MNKVQTAQFKNEFETSNKNVLPRIELPFPPTITPEEIINIKDGKIPSKPPNSFLIYRRAFQKQINENGILLKLSIVSTLASEQWKKEPIEVKKAYKQLALQVSYALVEMRAMEVKAKKYAQELEHLSDQNAQKSINEKAQEVINDDMEIYSQQFPSSLSHENQYFTSSPISFEEFSFLDQEENLTFLNSEVTENGSSIFNNASHHNSPTENYYCINEDTQAALCELPIGFNNYSLGFENFTNYAQIQEIGSLNYSRKNNIEILDFSNNLNMNMNMTTFESNQHFFNASGLDNYQILEYCSNDDNLTTINESHVYNFNL
ncbi:6899_t:CDS:1 [Ambispora leptoticha]|uniref:6899_t:CDS:1 n=1 Tax=Ambispora leptoticha TaxID=144679 RepID=A0A9N9CKJ2_9GLOM|nr:6899_t:CDS:1 [Ambispora leptoticha]